MPFTLNLQQTNQPTFAKIPSHHWCGVTVMWFWLLNSSIKGV